MPIQPFSRSRSCDILDDDSIDDNVACSFVSKRDEYNHEVGRTTEMEVKEHFERKVTLRLLSSGLTQTRTLTSKSVDDADTTSVCMTRECSFRLLPQNQTHSVSEQPPEQPLSE